MTTRKDGKDNEPTKVRAEYTEDGLVVHEHEPEEQHPLVEAVSGLCDCFMAFVRGR